MQFNKFDLGHLNLIRATYIWQSLAWMGHQLSKLTDIPALRYPLPRVRTDRHLWKQYLPVVLCITWTRGGGTYLGVSPPPILTWQGGGVPTLKYPLPPRVWTDRHLWKQYLPVVLYMRAVKNIISDWYNIQTRLQLNAWCILEILLRPISGSSSFYSWKSMFFIFVDLFGFNMSGVEFT